MFHRVIEVFTKNGEDNVFASLIFQPAEVCFLLDQNDSSAMSRFMNTVKFLKKRIAGIKVIYKEINFSKMLVIDKDLEALLDGAIIDIGGGEDRIKLPLLNYSLSHNLAICYFDMENESIIMMNSKEEIKDVKFPELTIADIIQLSGGELYQIKQEDLPQPSLHHKMIMKTALHNIKAWNGFSDYLSYVFSHYANGSLKVENAPMKIKDANGHTRSCDKAIFSQLTTNGILRNVHMKNNRLSFEVADDSVLNLMVRVGDVLEEYLYFELIQSKCFDEIVLSGKIDWSNYQSYTITVENEIDLIARRGRQLFFISCKSGVIKNEYINEIIVMAKRFGTAECVAVLATMDILEENGEVIKERCRYMDCLLIDGKDIEKKRAIRCLKSRFKEA